MSSEAVASRLVGSIHRLFNRAKHVRITEPMLHPTPFLFLYDHHQEHTRKTSGDTVPIESAGQTAVLTTRVAFQQYVPLDAEPYSVALEQQVQDSVHDLIKAFDNAGLDWQTYDGLLKLEESIHEKGTALDKIIEEHDLTGARTVVTTIDPLVFYSMLGDKDRFMGSMRDGELYPDALKETWKHDGLALQFAKGEGHHITPEVMYGSDLGKKVALYNQNLYDRYQQIHRNRYGGMMMGLLFFVMGLYTMYWQWQWINYRELERQRFKLAMRMIDPDAPMTEGQKNLYAKHKQFLSSYYEEDEEEEEEDEEEEEEAEEEGEEAEEDE
jgi:hypothetical protein